MPASHTSTKAGASPRVAYEERYAVQQNTDAQGASQLNRQAIFEDVLNVIDCKKSIAAMAERTAYGTSGEIIARFKWGEPESLDLAIGSSIAPGSMRATAQHLFCSGERRLPLLPKGRDPTAGLKYLGRTQTGDGDIFYDSPILIANPPYQFESLLVVKYDTDHRLQELIPGTVSGITGNFRTRADRIQLSCMEKRFQNLKWEHYDAQMNLTYVMAPISPPTIDVVRGSPIFALLSALCGPQALDVAGTYEGTNTVHLQSGGSGENKIRIIVNQNGEDVDVRFDAAGGGQGKGQGKLTGTDVKSMKLESTLVGCPGSYDASINFSDDLVTWFYKGSDCSGAIEGSGSAKRINR
jgi:hypothetical protein